MPSADCRVAVVGGGPAGATLATLLARRGVATQLLETSAEPADKPGECLPPNLSPLLRMLGLDAAMANDGHLPSFGRRWAWGDAQPVEEDFVAEPHGRGWHLDRRRFEARLRHQAEAAGVLWRAGRRVVGCEPLEHRIELRLADGSLVTAELVVDATGRTAAVARAFGARRVHDDALVGTVGYTGPDGRLADTYTLVEAIATGWWYSALRRDGSLVLALMTDGPEAPRNRDLWRARLAEAPCTSARLATHGGTIDGSLRRRPAGMARLDRISGARWLAIGDAATAFDPISSYGIGSALGSACEAADAIETRLAGSPEAFVAYDRTIEAAWTQCVAAWRQCYAAEGRWSDSPFWRRRRAEFGGARL